MSILKRLLAPSIHLEFQLQFRLEEEQTHKQNQFKESLGLQLGSLHLSLLPNELRHLSKQSTSKKLRQQDRLQ